MKQLENVVIVGATSGIAWQLCRVMARRGCHLMLVARDEAELDRLAIDLRQRFQANVAIEPLDVLDFDEHAAVVDRCMRHFQGELTGVVYCVGYLPGQNATQVDFAEAHRTIDINFSAAVSLLHGFASRIRKGGYVAAISSVAGDRGRQSNYTYGASKAGLTVFLEGLRHRLHAVGVDVITVKPGPVATPMIEGVMDPQSWQVASPERVAELMDRAIRQRKSVAYVPGYWWWIMKGIRWLPEWLFQRTRL